MAQVALYLPQIRMDAAEILRRAVAADEAGLAGIWFMDHMAAPMGPDFDTLEAWTIATAVAARTERIRVGHLVLCEAFRHPALLAKMAATLDHVSNGRLDLGLGWGSVEDELVSWGFPSDPASVRADRLDEAILVLRALLSGEQVDHNGTHFSLQGVTARPIPLQQPLPIHLGGAGERLTLPLVRRHADWWNCPGYGFDRFPELIAGLKADRPDLRISVQHPVGLASSAADREEVASVTQRRFGAWGGVVTGTPDEVAEQLAAEADQGVDLFICQLHDFGQSETIRLLAEEVGAALT